MGDGTLNLSIIDLCLLSSVTMTTISLSMSTLLFHNFQVFTGHLATQPDCIFWSHLQLSMATGVKYLCHVLFPIPFLLVGNEETEADTLNSKDGSCPSSCGLSTSGLLYVTTMKFFVYSSCFRVPLF